jgi:hypothetical protein
MLAHLDVRPRRRSLLERLGLRRDLSERLIERGVVPTSGDLVDEITVWVFAEEVARLDEVSPQPVDEHLC